ncbi:hypothetical protein EOK75_19565 (plasmid) [Pseudorhodobacter turbinis]|uniref:Uncharacterized protein n=1 Tax=Pseudorhodobacter turbinis TaxID=2500533 RepID=A0A4P8EKT2_9RHOB|nr:hypothetical protein [Pseudorhodobacter turbinis]QCO57851.1 hypothetical protein EOK75_19565 [Pseudorhodobacter turbinis]
MDINFHCKHPLNTVARVMDIARRMDIDFDQLTMRRKECGQFAVNFALRTGDQTVRDKFFTQLRQCHDLTQDKYDV